jgi:hypothetical protein
MSIKFLRVKSWPVNRIIVLLQAKNGHQVYGLNH